MPVTPAEAFEKRHIRRNDGGKVVPTSLALVAALESGYHFKLSDIEEGSISTRYPGMLTKDEFVELCEKHPQVSVTARDMAKHVSVIAPDGYITRASLQDIAAKAISNEDALNADEVDALFNTLDKKNTGSILSEQLMKTMYGKSGVVALSEQRMEYLRMKEKDDEEMAAAAAAKEAKEREERLQREKELAEAKRQEAEALAAKQKPVKKKTMCGC